MATTDAAARLLLRAKRAFAEMRHIQADLSALQGSLYGTINKVGLFSRDNHPLARQASPIPLEQLAAASWIVPRQDSPARQVLNRAFLAQRLPAPEPSVESGDLAILRKLLIDTDLITASSPHQLHYEIAAGQVVELPVRLTGTERRIGTTQRRGALPSPALTAMLEEIRSVVQASLAA